MKAHISISKRLMLILVTIFIGNLGIQRVSQGIDPDTPQIYWADATSYRIRRANLDGTNIQNIITGLETWPMDIALDIVDGKIYWSQNADLDRGIFGSIWRANLDGTHVQNVVTGLSYVRGIALDIGRKKIYWIDQTDWREEAREEAGVQYRVQYNTPKIQRSDFNGTNIQDIVTEKEILAGWGLHIAVDAVHRKIYWTLLDTIKCANLDGTNIQNVVVEHSPGLNLDVVGKEIYYFSSSGVIRRTNLDGTNTRNLIIGVDYADIKVEGGKMFWEQLEWKNGRREAQFWIANLDGTNTQKIFTLGNELITGFALSIPSSSDLIVDSSEDAAAPVEPTPLPEPPKIVSLPDRNLAAAVRKALDLGTNVPISKQAMQRLTRLDARESGIKNLTGLEHATQLGFLELRKNQITDIRPLANLKSLKELILEVNNVRDIRPLANLTQLTVLYIAANPISNFTPLANLTELRKLALWDSNISDVTLIADKVQLTHLHLWDNNISDISPLANLTQLQILHLERNQIRDVSPLSGLTKLTELTLRENPIADKSPLRTLKDRNPNLDLDIEIPPLSPVVHLEAAQRPPMYWVGATTGTLHGLVSDEVENLVPNVKNATSIAVDMAGGKLYWTEKTGERTGRIRRANLDGSNVRLVKNLTSVPYGIALDTVNGKLYLTNAYGKVQRLNLDGSNFQPNLITGLDTPRNLILDVTGGKIYWTETTEALGRIQRANLDGSGVQYLVGNLTEPLTLAVINDKLYWTSRTRENKGELQRANLNGFNHEVLETLPIAPIGIAVDTARRLLYLTLPSGEIHRRDLDGSGDEPVVTGLVSPSNIVLGITATTPGPTDAPEPSATSTVDTATDVNQDQKVNKTDLLLVVTALGENPPTNPNFDVNADGAVNIADVLLVIEALDDPVAAAAPSLGETETSLDPRLLTTHIERLRAESDGSLKYAHAIAFFQGLLASIRPTETQLLANYPNPFNPETWIPYQLAEPADVSLSIYAIDGKLVQTLALGHQPVGIYESRSRAAYWDGRNGVGEPVASGVYFYTLTAGDFTTTRKMLLRK